MADASGGYPHFRLNFEQQRKRAKDLLKAARAGDPAALRRFAEAPTLAQAQYLVARELRFADWAQLKRHIASMARERSIIATPGAAPDADLRTLHVRCGSDIQETLREAGFRGDFHEHSYPYLAGPVREGPDCLAQRARFLTDSYGNGRTPPLQFQAVLEHLQRDELRLLDSADYARVVIWSERDCYDQLVLVRLLGHYATQRRPRQLELINLGEFPGATRFLGLGQLPPEALRMLWATRMPATPAQLQLGLAAWRALASPDPRALAGLMRSATPALPLLAPALHRHLRELPSIDHGLSLTQALALAMLAGEALSLQQVFIELTYRVDPLPGQGDLQVRDRVLAMERVTQPLLDRRPGVDAHGRSNPPWSDVLSITDAGRAVLRGELDFLALDPPQRWVGGVAIGAGEPDWRWDERNRDALRR